MFLKREKMCREEGVGARATESEGEELYSVAPEGAHLSCGRTHSCLYEETGLIS